jgi:hypothetical protein
LWVVGLWVVGWWVVVADRDLPSIRAPPCGVPFP